MSRWFGAEYTEDARFVLRKNFDDAAGISRLVLLGIAHGLDAQKRAIADTRRRHAGARLARHMDENFRSLAETRFVPFDRRGDEFAVAVAAVMSASVTAGSVPAFANRLPRASIAPSLFNSASSSFRATRSPPLMLKARAISRLPIFAGDLPLTSRSRATKARMSSREGRGLCLALVVFK